MKLVARHIEVAQELKYGPCKFGRVVAHYQRHAEADEAVFDGYVLLVTTTLSHTPPTALSPALRPGRPESKSHKRGNPLSNPCLPRWMQTEPPSARPLIRPPRLTGWKKPARRCRATNFRNSSL